MERLFATYITALQSYSKRGVVAFLVCVGLGVGLIASGVILLNNTLLVEKPLPGGMIVEGVIGSPYAINPVLAVSQTDKDLTALIFSGLMRKDSTGNMIHDLAQEHTVSNDGLTYTFILKENAEFHDGKPVTAYDVVYTISKIQDPTVRSPHRIKWEGIEVKAIDDRTVQFVLKRPFPELIVNSSIGILPKHLFENNPSEAFSVLIYNTEPIGSGPYKIHNVTRNNGVPVRYTLERNRNFTLGSPLLESIHVHVFDSEESVANALKNRDITNASSLSASYAHVFVEGGHLEAKRALLPSAYGLFINQNKVPALQDVNVRRALSESLDRALMTYGTFYGFGTPITTAAPTKYRTDAPLPTQKTKEEVIALLEKAGWSKNVDGILVKNNQPLTLTIATIDIPELTKIADFVKNYWKDLGIEVKIDSYSLGDLRDVVVADRSFEILLYGIVVDEDADLYTYWHSSGRNHPGLNVAQYANKRVDTILESIRNGSGTPQDVQTALSQIESDIPAIFLFSPDFVYITEKKLRGIQLSHIEGAEDRFRDVYMWYKNTERVWPALLYIPFFKTIESFIYSL